MKAILNNISLSALLFALSFLQVSFIYLFIKCIKFQRNRATLRRRKKDQHTAGRHCDDRTTERIYQKTLAKIQRSHPGKIIVSASLYSELYFFTEN
jgi:hypothetical protein